MITLLKVPFSRDQLPLVAGFNCGTEFWEREVAEWIAGDITSDSALRALARGEADEVWLYKHPEQGRIVGFGSLGPTSWEWPTPADGLVPITLIPALGMHVDFHGHPPDVAKNDRFSRQIMSHLLFEALK